MLIGSLNAPSTGAELNSTPVAGANDTAIGANKQEWAFFTLPTASAFYVITGVEWLNGTVVNGSCLPGVRIVQENPPVTTSTMLAAYALALVQTGASAVQRTSQIVSAFIPGGKIVGAYIATGSATGRYGTTTVSSSNSEKSITAAADVATGDSTTWTAKTEAPYIKVYYKPVI